MLIIYSKNIKCVKIKLRYWRFFCELDYLHYLHCSGFELSNFTQKIICKTPIWASPCGLLSRTKTDLKLQKSST